MPNALSVGLGEMIISRNAEDVLVAFGLGSCLGIGMYDRRVMVAGMVHAVLPQRDNGGDPLSPKYVDSGLDALLKAMHEAGAQRDSLILRVAGGANMLVAPGMSSFMNIGERNAAVFAAKVVTLNLAVQAHDLGGHVGRTVRLYVANGRLTVRSMGQPERDL
jgi:chemotaxis protein CheD